MKSLLVTILAIVGAIAPCIAGVTYQQSGPHNMHIRVEGNYRYLLLPIQDNGPEYHVQLIENNHLYRNLVLRLATEGKVDFYVPLDLQGIDLNAFYLNVRFGREPIAWDKMQVANEYDATNTDYYRPLFHHTPAYGWMNDPNGMFYDEQAGLWHLYYQYNPYASKWQNMTWGHSTSKDLLHWDVAADLLDYRTEDHNLVGFQYVDFMIEGDDILYLCRTAINGAHNFHDANYQTFHRIRNFRDL